MKDSLSRKIDIASVINFRDLGGYQNCDGATVAWRKIFRSGDFRKLTDADFTHVRQEIRLATVIDLRSKEEIETQGKWGWDAYGINYHNIPFPAGGGNKAEESKLLSSGVNLGDFYLHIVGNKHFPKQIKKALEIIADPKNYPIVYHCAIGKDRTGILSALVLGVLGVDDRIIIEDYTLSNSPVQKLHEEMLKNPPNEDFIKRLPAHFWEAAPETMDIFLTGLKQQHGSVIRYLIDLGIDNYLIKSIRKNLLV